MSRPGAGRARRAVRSSRSRGLVRRRLVRGDGSRGLVRAVLFTVTAVAGCEVPFEPFEESTVGRFSIYGYLDLKADTQWIRVTPIRQEMVPDAAAIDAMVTLEHLGSGRMVTLRDSLFTYRDPGLDGVGYAHNFWTTEPIEPEATYRLRVVPSDGAETSVRVEMPPELVVSLTFWQVPEIPDVWAPRHFSVHGEHLLYTDVMYTVWDTALGRGVDPLPIRQDPVTTTPGRWGFINPPDPLDMPPFSEAGRREIRIAVAGADWPYEDGLSAADLTIPGALPSTVENGVGSVRGVATWTIPLPLCEPVEARPDGREPCSTELDAGSASIVGTVTRDPCGDPRQLPTLRLTERYADGGAVVWQWKADWDGRYRFDGLEPGADLRLELVDDPAEAVQIAPLDPGERYVAPDVTVPSSC